MKESLLVAATILAVLITCNQIAFAQATDTDKERNRIAKIRKDVEKIGVGRTITVSRLDNRDFFGRVKQIDSEHFEIIETDSKLVHIFKFRDLKNVREGDGTSGYVTGRKNPRSRWFVFAAVVGGLILLPVIALSADK